MLAIRCVGVCVPVRESLCLLWRETHTKGLRVISPARPEAEKGRKVPKKDRESQLTKEGRREQSAWDSCPEKNTVSWRRRWEDESRQSRDESAFLVALWKFRTKYTLVIACKCTETSTKVSHRLSFACACSWPKFVFVRLFFSSTLSVVFCVFVKKRVMPVIGNHWMNHWPWVVWFKEDEIVGVGRPGMLSQFICH